MADGDPEDDLDLEAPEPDLEDEGLDTDEQDSPDEPSPDQAAAEAGQDDQQQREEPPARQQERQPSRSENRIRTLTEEVRAARQREADMSRRLDEISRNQQQRQPAGESPEQRAQRQALMTPEERIAETLRESETRMQMMLQQTQLQNHLVADRTAFQAKVAANPVYAKWAPKVEALLAERAARGETPVEREVALRWLLGDAMIKQSSSKEGRQQVRQAQQRVKANQVRPSNSGSDTQPQRRQATSVERRLENVQI